MTDTPRNESLAQRIEQRLEEIGISARAASLKVSDNPDLIRNVLNGRSENPRVDTMDLIAEALQTTSDWLMARSDEKVAPIVGGEVRPANVPLPLRQAMPNDVPVRGTAAGSHLAGAFQLDNAAIDWVRRPPGMTGARDLYALYIEGTSMEPEHRPGDLRFVHPHRPPRMGDSVIVQFSYNENEVQGVIGHLVGRTEKVIKLGKLKPEAVVELKREHVIAIHKVLTLNELFGL